MEKSACPLGGGKSSNKPHLLLSCIDSDNAIWLTRVFPLFFLLFSACTCDGEDHPGPSVKKGRGAPEIDVLEAQKNKRGPGAKVSQSAQFAPFSHDYIYPNASQDDWWVYNTVNTQPNTYL